LTVRPCGDSSGYRGLKIELGRITLKVTRDGRNFTVDVASDGEGLVSHAGAVLLAETADRVGLTRALSVSLAGVRERRGRHDPGRVIRDLAVMLADGGDCLADLRVVRDQEPLFGPVASDTTAFRLIDRVAAEPGLLDGLRAARAKARKRAWELGARPKDLTIDVDATLIGAHSEKEGAAGTFKGGFGFHPLLGFLDGSRESLAAILRPGNAGANTAADHIAVVDAALEQLPRDVVEHAQIVVRTDSAGATHEFLDYLHEGQLGYLCGYDLTESVRRAILDLPENTWVPALRQDGSERDGAQVAELTDQLDLAAWPEGSRVIVRREQPHPGAQLSFTDHDGHRFLATLTDQSSEPGELDRTHPGAAGSLREGMDETLTVTRLQIRGKLKRTLESTNACESMIEIVRRTQRNVKHWSSGEMGLRWTAAGMLEAEQQFRKVIGHTDLAKLAVAIERDLNRTRQEETPAPDREAAIALTV
jgi:hypothetical protein